MSDQHSTNSTTPQRTRRWTLFRRAVAVVAIFAALSTGASGIASAQGQLPSGEPSGCSYFPVIDVAGIPQSAIIDGRWNLRGSPNTSSCTFIRTLPDRTVVTVYQTEGAWSLVLIGGSEWGWLSSDAFLDRPSSAGEGSPSSCTFVPAPFESQELGYLAVTTGRFNIRTAPNTAGCTWVDTLPAGVQVTVSGDHTFGNWRYVDVPGRGNLWIHKSGLQRR